MSTVTAKEKNMLMVIVVLVLYAVAALCYRKQQTEWKKRANILKNAQKKYVMECVLIDAGNEWDEKYKTMCSLMPVFPYEKDVDTHWLNIMDTVASEQSLAISRRQIGKEEEVGDVFELPVECKNWEGSLKSLVGFLYGLRQEGAMLDVRQIFVKPSSKPGYLKGTFSLYCAYMRGDVVEEESGVGSQETEVGSQESGVGSQESGVGVTEEDSEQKAVQSGTQDDISKSAAVPVPQKKEKILQTEIKGAEVKDARADVEEAAVKAALDALKKNAE